jgi:outer membrane protein W
MIYEIRLHMIKYFLTFCLIIMVMIPAGGFAEEDHHNHLFSVQGGVFVPTEEGDGTGYNVLVSYDYIFPNGFSIGLESGYKEFERELSMDIIQGPDDKKVGERTANVEVVMIPFNLNAKYHFLSNKQFKPYFGAGLGTFISVVDFSEFDDIADDEGHKWFERDKTGLGIDFHGLAGIRFMIADNVSLFAEVRYSYEIQIQERAENETDDLNLGGLFGNGGIAVEF